jgi:hypothetical protein
MPLRNDKTKGETKDAALKGAATKGKDKAKPKMAP